MCSLCVHYMYGVETKCKLEKHRGENGVRGSKKCKGEREKKIHLIFILLLFIFVVSTFSTIFPTPIKRCGKYSRWVKL